MIDPIFNRQPSQALYRARDRQLPVPTGASRNFVLSSFLSFATQSANSGLMHRSISAYRKTASRGGLSEIRSGV